MKKLFVCNAVLALFLFLSFGLAYPASDILLEIDGVEGESLVAGHQGAIDVLSWSWGVSQSGTLHTGVGGGSGKTQIQDISLIKYVDKSSVNLFRKCFNGSHFTEAVLIVRKAGEDSIDYVEITMSPVMVTSISTGGVGGDDRLTESITLNFGKIKFSYTPQKVDGSPDAALDITWNIETNREE